MGVLSEEPVYQTEKPTLSDINLLYLIIVTTACHRPDDLDELKASHLKSVPY